MKIKNYIFFISALIGASISACKKNNDAPAAAYTSNLNIINASTDTVNLYLNGGRLNSNSNLYPLYSTGYLSVPAFAQNFQVKKLFNPTTNTVQQLFSIPLNLDTAKGYSLFIAGETVKQAFNVEDLIYTDTTSAKCHVRFVNASPDSNKYDMAIGSAKITGKGFGTASDFTYADTSSTAQITLYPAGSSAPIASYPFALAGKRWYTIYSIGKAGGTGSSALSFVIMINN